MEYPGYGLYDKKEPSEEQIFEDLESVIAYSTSSLLFQKEKIVLLGTGY